MFLFFAPDMLGLSLSRIIAVYCSRGCPRRSKALKSKLAAFQMLSWPVVNYNVFFVSSFEV